MYLSYLVYFIKYQENIIKLKKNRSFFFSAYVSMYVYKRIYKIMIYLNIPHKFYAICENHNYYSIRILNYERYLQRKCHVTMVSRAREDEISHAQCAFLLSEICEHVKREIA